jgi:CRISPR-associated protein Cas5d
LAREHVLEVWGDFACFTRPELKVERYSYPFITPSAARGVFDAIFCKPARDPTQAQFRWQVTRIEILREPAYIALRRNEVTDVISSTNARQWMTGGAPPVPIYAEEVRTQRQTMALRNVRYRLHARIEPWPRHRDRLPAFEEQFIRRASQGKCVYQPYLGCREFPAFFEMVGPDSPPCTPIPWDADDVGFMVYDTFDQGAPGGPMSKPSISVFRPIVRRGVVEVPDYGSDKVLRPVGGGEAC